MLLSLQGGEENPAYCHHLENGDGDGDEDGDVDVDGPHLPRLRILGDLHPPSLKWTL